ncbi:hypothetical protein [Endozoicomonas lisbonensis]|uniref:Transposase n=1 Tax=Endozoicomonas lisbonensis TaxID=3120522 RepID=A0ABV2SL61_9GAMM
MIEKSAVVAAKALALNEIICCLAKNLLEMPLLSCKYFGKSKTTIRNNYG